MKKLNMRLSVPRLKVVVLPLIIFIAAFFFFMQGVGSLRAQEAPEIASQKGWFVGVNPLIFGANKIETKTTVVSTGGGKVTVSDLTADLFTPRQSDTLTDQIEEIAVNICKGTETRLEIFYLAADHSDATDFTNSAGGVFEAFRFRLHGAEIPYTRSLNESIISPIADDECKKAFDGLLLEDQASTAGSSETSTGKALAGNGLQVGYRDGDYRYSFSNFSWAAGADKLDSQVLLLEYFIAKGFSAGIGVANVKLDSSAGLHSQRANVFSLSYSYRILKNLFVEASYMLIQADISLQKEEVKDIVAVNQTDTRVLGFFSIDSDLTIASNVIGLNYDNRDGASYNTRSTVTRTQTRAAGSIRTIKSVEIKNPAAFRINFIWRFR